VADAGHQIGRRLIDDEDLAALGRVALRADDEDNFGVVRRGGYGQLIGRGSIAGRQGGGHWRHGGRRHLRGSGHLDGGESDWRSAGGFCGLRIVQSRGLA
jgi:hypothetical protein